MVSGLLVVEVSTALLSELYRQSHNVVCNVFQKSFIYIKNKDAILSLLFHNLLPSLIELHNSSFVVGPDLMKKQNKMLIYELI